jgi:hypothetical protein
LKRLITTSIGWQPISVDEIKVADTIARTSDFDVTSILDELNPEEATRFEQQVIAANDALIKLGRQRIEMQSLPLGKPDPAPKRRYIKKKTYGKADARELTGAELADRALVTK